MGVDCAPLIEVVLVKQLLRLYIRKLHIQKLEAGTFEILQRYLFASTRAEETKGSIRWVSFYF